MIDKKTKQIMNKLLKKHAGVWKALADDGVVLVDRKSRNKKRKGKS